MDHRNEHPSLPTLMRPILTVSKVIDSVAAPSGGDMKTGPKQMIDCVYNPSDAMDHGADDKTGD